MLLKKAIVSLLLSVLMITSMQLSYAADDSLVSITGAVLNDQLNFKLNGVNVIPVGDDGTPVLPISYNGTTYLPIRAIGYLLGLGIDYEGSTKSVLITSSTSKVPPAAIQSTKTNQLIPITNVVLNKALKFKLDTQPVIPSGDDGTPVLPVSYNGTTYLPVRAIGNLLNLGISYDGNTKTVLITKQNPTGGTPITQNPTGNTPVTQNPAGSTTITQSKVWKLKEVKFTDATSYKESVLMGTSSYMYDTIGFTGGQNDLIISHNRYDKETNKALAGIKYQVTWTNPPEYLAVGQKITINYELKTLASLTWTNISNSIKMDQGMGVYFVASDGTKYIKTNMKADFTSEKAVEAGSKGRTRKIEVYHSEGFKTEYIYEWIN